MLHLYNSLSRQVEPFRPLDAPVTLYVCGITPYDTTHLGHAFTYASFDILVRYLEWLGLPVRYVQNVTDIDDDILRRAHELQEDWQALGNRWTRRFVDDMTALNVRPPDCYPRATDVIAEMIHAISALLDHGDAYLRGGSAYFRARCAPLGAIGHLPAEEWLRIAATRGNVAEDPNKEDPLDFVLWQAQASPNEPAWPSPWGPGRPGWHIECSTIAGRFLGPTIDIHGGGADLAFPHHEAELGQAARCSSQPAFARYWLHTGMVSHLGEKMSKSLGNLVMVSDLLQAHPADALRLYLAQHHYRQGWAYEPAALAEAAATARRWQEAASATDGRASAVAAACRAEFHAAMDDDLDTPRAALALDALAGALLEGLPDGTARASQGPPPQETLRELAGVLGLRLNRSGPEPRVVDGWQAHKARFPAPAPG
jgi:L-cysteine:1D-myo-inositol 2-amino-2-deoxy-alpha-D-glucopyranoside ligase